MSKLWRLGLLPLPLPLALALYLGTRHTYVLVSICCPGLYQIIIDGPALTAERLRNHTRRQGGSGMPFCQRLASTHPCVLPLKQHAENKGFGRSHVRRDRNEAGLCEKIMNSLDCPQHLPFSAS